MVQPTDQPFRRAQFDFRGIRIEPGNVKHFGLSEVPLRAFLGAHAVQPVAALQSAYSLIERVVESNVQATCEELGIGFVPWDHAQGLPHRPFQPRQPLRGR